MNYARLLFLSPPPLLHSIYTVSFQTSFITELALWSTLVSFFLSLSLSYFSLLYTHGVRIKEKDRKKRKRERETPVASVERGNIVRRLNGNFFFFIDSLTKFLQRKMLPGINSGISLVLFLLVTYIIVFVEFSSSNSSPGGNAPMEIIPIFFFFFFDVIRVLTEILRYINSCLSLSLVKRRCELKDFFSNQIISRLNINYVRRKIGTPRIYLFCVVVK